MEDINKDILDTLVIYKQKLDHSDNKEFENTFFDKLDMKDPKFHLPTFIEIQ